MKIKPSAQDREVVWVTRSQKRIIKIASQHRYDEKSLASNQSGQRCQIPLLLFWRNSSGKQLFQLVHYERELHLGLDSS